MEGPPITEEPPPVPNRSPLREAADVDILGIFHIDSDEDDADAGLQTHYDVLSKSIDDLIECLRPGASSTSLVSMEHASTRRRKPYLQFSSGVASPSSIYSQDRNTCSPYTSAPTSSRPSYSSLRPVSTASTHTNYSAISVSPSTKATPNPTMPPTSITTMNDAPQVSPTAKHLFNMIEQLPPIIYRHCTTPPAPAMNDLYDGDDVLFPPHPGVRPPPTNRYNLKAHQTSPVFPANPVPSVPRRAASLGFSLRKRRAS